MNKFAWAVVLALTVSLVAVGCGGDKKEPPKPAPGGAVAVVNFAQLLKDLGYQDRVNGYLKQADGELTALRDAALKADVEKRPALEKAFREAVAKVTATQPAADKAALLNDPAVFAAAQALDQNTIKLQGGAAQYQEALKRYAQRLEEAWQAALMPALAQVAKEANVQIVLGKPTVPYNTHEVDLTARLADYFKQHPAPAFAAPPAKDQWDIPPFSR